MFKAITTSIYILFSGIFGIQLYIPVQNTPIATSSNTAVSQKVSTTTQAKKINITKNTETVPPTIKTPSSTPKKQETQPKELEQPVMPMQSPPKIPFEIINVNTRKAVVNIFCTTKSAGSLYPVTGSGVLISGNGVILTNAHIAQYFLLKDFNGEKNFVDCYIRTGSPAYPTYRAELVYLSPSWIADNKTTLTEQNPTGTGEHDYAFLRITEKIDESIVGVTPYLPINLSENNKVGLYTLLASYPAGFLGGQSILRDLYQSSSIVTIANVFTFDTGSVDLISIGGSVVSQKGSSGGAVVNDDGELIGIISTESEALKTSDRDLRAITMSYINNDLKNESGSSIIDILSFPTEYAKNFNETIAPKLTEILTKAILKK